MGSSRRIEAAGGLLWREDDGQLQVALVHRPRYDDWSLPKGKVETGERSLPAAIREVHEETGAEVSVSRRLGEVRYRVDSADKVVRFWAMRYLGGTPDANAEVDDVVWLDASDAKRRLSYAGERTIVDAFSRQPVPLSVVVVIRHAKAGKRADWSGPDDLRPLDRAGRVQAKALSRLGRLFEPRHVVAAVPLRCQQTVQPLADRLGLAIDVDPAFSDAVSTVHPEVSRDALADLVRSDDTVVVCSQGETMTALLDANTAKGAAWVLGCRDGRVVSSDYYRARARLEL